MKYVVLGALGATLTFSQHSKAEAAPGGWSAVQKSRSAGSDTEQTAQVSYGHHRLRVDNPGQRLIVDFEGGALLYVDTANKAYARVTLEEMVALRDKQLKAVRSQLDQMPPAVRKQMEAQIAEAEKSSKRTIQPKASGKSETVNGFNCQLYTWSSSDGEGRACIARKVPFDARDFRQDSVRLSRQMRKLGAGTAASSMAILQLGEHGFPMRIEQKLKLGPNVVDVTSTFEDLKAAKLPKDHFAPPKGFKKRDFETMMAETVSAPPKTRPAPTE